MDAKSAFQCQSKLSSLLLSSVSNGSSVERVLGGGIEQSVCIEAASLANGAFMKNRNSAAVKYLHIHICIFQGEAGTLCLCAVCLWWYMQGWHWFNRMAPLHRYFVSYKLGRQANLNLLSLNAKGNKVPAGHVLCRCGL